MKKLFIFVSLIAATASFAAKQVAIDPVTRLPIGETIPRLIGPMIDVTTGLPIGRGFGSEKMDVTGIDPAYQEAVNKLNSQRAKLSAQRAAELALFYSGQPKQVANNQTIPAYGLSPHRTIKSEKQFNEFNKGFDTWKQMWEQGHGFKTTLIPSEKVFGTMTYSTKRGYNQTWPMQLNPRIYSGGLAKLPDHIIEAKKIKDNEDKEIRKIIERHRLRTPRFTDISSIFATSTIEDIKLAAIKQMKQDIISHKVALKNINFQLFAKKATYLRVIKAENTTTETKRKLELDIKRVESARAIVIKQMETYRKLIKENGGK